VVPFGAQSLRLHALNADKSRPTDVWFLHFSDITFVLGDVRSQGDTVAKVFFG
jgi:hypothetical protein